MSQVPTSIFLDTNILFRVVTQGQPGCELEHWLELSRRVESAAALLLVPEVVMLELEKLYTRLDQELSTNLARLQKAIAEQFSGVPKKEKAIWNEMGDLSPKLEAVLEGWKEEKLNGAKKRYEIIRDFVNSEHAVRVPLDGNVLLRARRRVLAGRFANSTKENPEADCCILESLIAYFEEHGVVGQLMFCTENAKDFCVPLKEGRQALHPAMKTGLPPAQVFTNLASLVEFMKAQGAVEEPRPEELHEALEREKSKQIEEEVSRSSLEGFSGLFDPSQVLSSRASGGVSEAFRRFGEQQERIGSLAGFSDAVRRMGEQQERMASLAGFSDAVRRIGEQQEAMRPLAGIEHMMTAAEMMKPPAALEHMMTAAEAMRPLAGIEHMMTAAEMMKPPAGLMDAARRIAEHQERMGALTGITDAARVLVEQAEKMRPLATGSELPQQLVERDERLGARAPTPSVTGNEKKAVEPSGDMADAKRSAAVSEPNEEHGAEPEERPEGSQGEGGTTS